LSPLSYVFERFPMGLRICFRSLLTQPIDLRPNDSQ
jgi:hypothetical protein